jgi:hypothetical protein
MIISILIQTYFFNKRNHIDHINFNEDQNSEQN